MQHAHLFDSEAFESPAAPANVEGSPTLLAGGNPLSFVLGSYLDRRPEHLGALPPVGPRHFVENHTAGVGVRSGLCPRRFWVHVHHGTCFPADQKTRFASLGAFELKEHSVRIVMGAAEQPCLVGQRYVSQGVAHDLHAESALRQIVMERHETGLKDQAEHPCINPANGRIGNVSEESWHITMWARRTSAI